jgi:hypothetical protein
LTLAGLADLLRLGISLEPSTTGGSGLNTDAEPLLRKLRMLPVGLRMLPVGLNVPIALLLRLPLPSSSLVLAIGDHKLVAVWKNS